MKKEFRKPVLWCIFLFVYWLLDCWELTVFNKTYVYFISFSLSIVVLFVVKKEWIGLLGLFAVLVPTAIYEVEYLFTVFPVVLLCYAHFSAVKILKERKERKSAEGLTDIYTTMSFILMIGQIVYSLVVYQSVYPHRTGNIFYILRLAPVFIGLFVFLIVQSFNKKTEKKEKVDEKSRNSLKMIYFTALFGTVIKVWTFYAVNDYEIQSSKAEYLFWFLFLMLMVLNKDPFVYFGIKNIENRLENL